MRKEEFPQVISTLFSLGPGSSPDSRGEPVEKEIKGNHPYSFSLVRLTACMPACLPWAMFMLCPARDRIDSPTQHCALIQNLSGSGKPEPQSHSLSLLRIRPCGLWQHGRGCINGPKIASPRPAEVHVHPRHFIRGRIGRLLVLSFARGQRRRRVIKLNMSVA